MTTTLTPGRFRGLKTTSLAEADVFGIIAFDQRGSYRKMMPPAADYTQLVAVKNEIIGALSRDASAILTDPTYGLSAAMQMNAKSGLLLALEKAATAAIRPTARPNSSPPGRPRKSAKPAPARSS